MNSTRRKSLRLAAGGAVAAAFAAIAPRESLAAGDAVKVKKAKVATVTVKLYRVSEKGKVVVATIDLPKVAENLAQMGNFELFVHAGTNEHELILAESKVTVEKD